MAGLRADPALLAAIPRMHPWESNQLAGRQIALADKGHEYLIYSASGGTIRVDLTGINGEFQVNWVDPASGALTAHHGVSGGSVQSFTAADHSAVLWLTRKNP